jgi:hexosaminidase
MTQASHLYLDHPYEPDPEERGNHWATRFTDTRKIFGFLPDNVYANTEGGACTRPGQCVELIKKNNIIGR